VKDLTAIFGPDGFNADAVLSEARLEGTGVNAEIEFQRALEEYGLWVDGPIVATGDVVRCAVRDKRHSSSKPGWYIWWGPVGTSDVYVGCYGDWRAGDTGEKWVSRDVEALSAEHRAKYEDAMAKMRQAHAEEKERQHEAAAQEAQRIFDEAGPASPGHPYLARKQVRAHGIKQSGSRLIIPCRNAAGQIRTLQFIDSNATKEKLLLKGGQKRGCFHLIGSRLESPAYVAEGYSTGATVHELTGRPVVVAIDAHNIGPVIQSLRESRYSGRLIVAADNDRFRAAGNTGVEAAESAAAADAAVSVVVPQFKGSAEGTDFNDLAALEGREVAEAQLRAALEDVDGAEDSYQRNLAVASGRMKIEVTERDTRQAVPFPVQSLEELTRWICERTGAEYDVGPQMAALSVAALAASRRYRTPQDTGVHLYQMVSSAAYSSDAKPLFNAVQDVLHQSGLEQMYCEQGITGPASLIKTLYSSPALLYVKTDWGCKVFGPQSSSIDSVAKNLGEYYDKRFVPIRNPHEIGLKKSDLHDTQDTGIYIPAPNLLAFVQETDLGRAFAEHRMGRGVNESCLFARLPANYPGDPCPRALPEGLISRIQLVRGLDDEGKPEATAIYGDITELMPADLICADFSAAPPEQRYSAIMDLSDMDATRPIRMQAKAVLRRLAALLAIWQQPARPVVTPVMMDWAEQFVAWSVRELISARQFGGGEDDTSSTYEKALSYITQAGAKGITPGVLRASCRGFRNLSTEDRDKMVIQMLEDGDVIKHPTRRNALVAAGLMDVQEVKQ